MKKKQEKREEKKKDKKSRHHIIPSSRGGTDKDKNISVINNQEHRDYHTLFGNMTPEEITEYLVKYFWRGNYNF